MAKALNGVLQERLLSVVVKRFLRCLNGCQSAEVRVNSEVVVLTPITMENGFR